MDLYDAVSYHQLSLSAAGRSPATLRKYLVYEKRFLEFLETRGLPADLDQLNPLNARQAVMWFQQRQVGGRSGEVAAKDFLGTLKILGSFLEHEGVWEISPLTRIQRMRVRQIERQPYTRAEVGAMLNAAESSRTPERDRALILLLLDTGARIGEVTGLHVGDVRLDLRTVKVLGKGNKERTIPIGVPSAADGGPLCRAIRAWLKRRERYVATWPERAGDRLLLTSHGFPLTPDGGTEVVKRLGEVAGVEGAIPHRFRHLYATLYLQQYPGDEIGLRRILGQVSADVMRSYVHLANTEIAQRAGRVSPAQQWLRGTGA